MDWNAMAAPWLAAEAEMDAAHAPAKQGLMERAQLQNGQKVLDIGPGGGASLLDAADAVGPNGQVVGIEIAPPFVERALQRVPANVDVQVGDAATHHFEPAEFDAAISLFGVMFFTDPTAAFAHIRTALKPGAVLTFACWGPPQSNPWFSMPGGVATDVFGPGPSFDPDVPGPMAFSDTAKIDRILTGSGWQVDIDTAELMLTPKGTPADVRDLQMTIGAAAMRMEGARESGELTDDHVESVRAGLLKGFSEMVQGDKVLIPAQIHFVRATA